MARVEDLWLEGGEQQMTPLKNSTGLRRHSRGQGTKLNAAPYKCQGSPALPTTLPHRPTRPENLTSHTLLTSENTHTTIDSTAPKGSNHGLTHTEYEP